MRHRKLPLSKLRRLRHEVLESHHPILPDYCAKLMRDAEESEENLIVIPPALISSFAPLHPFLDLYVVRPSEMHHALDELLVDEHAPPEGFSPSMIKMLLLCETVIRSHDTGVGNG